MSVGSPCAPANGDEQAPLVPERTNPADLREPPFEVPIVLGACKEIVRLGAQDGAGIGAHVLDAVLGKPALNFGERVPMFLGMAVLSAQPGRSDVRPMRPAAAIRARDRRQRPRDLRARGRGSSVQCRIRPRRSARRAGWRDQADVWWVSSTTPTSSVRDVDSAASASPGRVTPTIVGERGIRIVAWISISVSGA